MTSTVTAGLPPAGLAPDDSGWFNATAHRAAVGIADQAIDSALHGPVNVPAPDGGTDMHVTLLDAPAGGGKTFIIVQTVRRARAAGRRVLVVTPGNDQLGELARRVQYALAADGLPGRIVVLHAQGRLRDDILRQLTAAGVATVTRPLPRTCAEGGQSCHSTARRRPGARVATPRASRSANTRGPGTACAMQRLISIRSPPGGDGGRTRTSASLPAWPVDWSSSTSIRAMAANAASGRCLGRACCRVPRRSEAGRDGTSTSPRPHPSRAASADWGPGVDVRADGGYIVAPPSRHASGRLYRWITTAVVARLPAPLAVQMAPPLRSEVHAHSAIGNSDAYGHAVLEAEARTVALA